VIASPPSQYTWMLVPTATTLTVCVPPVLTAALARVTAASMS
jgi:hypothetical protein